MASDFENLLMQCDGVRHTSSQRTDWRGQSETVYKFYKTGDIIVPDEVYIEIIGTATNGTVGKVIGFDIDKSRKVGDQISRWDFTYLYEAEHEGKAKKGRINVANAKILTGKHPTKYVRNVNKHKKVEVKNPVNKYKQELQRGDFVIGVLPSKRLGIGRITRWTNHNVWAVNGDDLDDKSAEFKFDSISQTYTFPNSEEVEELLTFAMLAGWDGH